MDLVVDANVIFAAIIKEGKTHELLFDGRLHLFTPEFFFTEFEKHSMDILKKTGKTLEELHNLMEVLEKKIVLVPLEELLPYLDEAEKICPDPDDVAYFSLALKLRCAIWSQDRALREKQDKIRVYSTGILDKMLE